MYKHNREEMKRKTIEVRHAIQNVQKEHSASGKSLATHRAAVAALDEIDDYADYLRSLTASIDGGEAK